ncbi:hypothetical protein R3P38DRAFT_2785720 [Favolaschia claudopus]|uniref:Uncharacterized protein n=1 Tax=Favolaschia claudopus TaxID=2862362 RepID=A0AAW0ATU2_9AGAR
MVEWSIVRRFNTSTVDGVFGQQFEPPTLLGDNTFDTPRLHHHRFSGHLIIFPTLSLCDQYQKQSFFPTSHHHSEILGSQLAITRRPAHSNFTVLRSYSNPPDWESGLVYPKKRAWEFRWGPPREQKHHCIVPRKGIPSVWIQDYDDGSEEGTGGWGVGHQEVRSRIRGWE